MPPFPLSHLLLSAFFILTSAFTAPAAVFTTDTTINEGDTTVDGQDIIVSNATVNINGPHGFNSVLLTNNAVLPHSPCTKPHRPVCSISSKTRKNSPDVTMRTPNGLPNANKSRSLLTI